MISEQPDARPIRMTGVERGSRTVVVGLGSPIMCDDAVGLRVSEAIDAMDFEDVDCCQEAVGGLDILPVIHGYRYAIIVDAIQTGEYGPGTVEDLSAAIRRKMLEEDAVPEPFGAESGRAFWPDLW